MHLKNKNIVVYIILIISLVLPILLYNGSIDPFAPYDVIFIDEINHSGHLTQDMIPLTPGFYVTGSIISLVANIQSELMIFLPVQLLSIIMILYIVIRRISNSEILASLIALLFSVSDTVSSKFYFWPHGMGYIITIMIIFLAIYLIKTKKLQFIILILISIISISYISYDQSLLSLLFLTGIIIMLVFYQFLKNRSIHINMTPQLYALMFLLIIFIIVLTGLSDFLYDTLIPQISYIGQGPSALQKFLSAYIFSKNANVPLDYISIKYPPVLVIMDAIKYVILAMLVFLALFSMIRNYLKNKYLGIYDLILLSVIFMEIAYSISRMIIGQFVIGTLFFGGIISVSILYLYFQKIRLIRYLLIFSILVLIVLYLMTYFVNFSNNEIDKDNSYFTYMNPSIYWYNNYCNGTWISDTETKSFYCMETSKLLYQAGDNVSYNDLMYKYSNVLNIDDINSLIQKISKNKVDNGYYIINNRLNQLELDEWIVIKPWKDYENLGSNTRYDKIYDDHNINILF